MSKTKIFVAGHNGMVGSAITRYLENQNVEIIIREKKNLNLLNQLDVQNFFKNTKIDQVYLAAAKVGGISANYTYPAEFIYNNLTIQNNVIHSAFLNGIKKLLFLGSSCIYPKNVNQPMKETDLLSGKLESTNEPYAISKIAGIKMCESFNRQYGSSHGVDYRCIMPTNLYGPGDNYHPENSHVIPGLIYRFHQAKINQLSSVTIWGTGLQKREFLYVDDLAKASIYIMNLKKEDYYNNVDQNYNFINIGTGEEIKIKDLAETIKQIINYNGEINFDLSRPDGTARKLLDCTRMHKVGFKPKINLREGLIKTFKDYIKFYENF